jgi:uncharacterized membrane protein
MVWTEFVKGDSLQFVKVLLLLLVVDSVYLYIISGWAQTMVVKIQRLYSPVRYVAAAIVYLLLALGLTHFIIKPRKPLWEAALLGFIVYGVFDFTNMAMFKHYDLQFAIVDTVWGAALSAIVAWLAMRF